jgi:hypothetical protein
VNLTGGARLTVTEGEGVIAGLRKLEVETTFGNYATAAQEGWAERVRVVAYGAERASTGEGGPNSNEKILFE